MPSMDRVVKLRDLKLPPPVRIEFTGRALPVNLQHWENAVAVVVEDWDYSDVYVEYRGEDGKGDPRLETLHGNEADRMCTWARGVWARSKLGARVEELKRPHKSRFD